MPFSLIMACVGLRKSENHMTLSHYWKTLGNDFELWRYPSCNEKGIIKVYSKKKMLADFLLTDPWRVAFVCVPSTTV